MAGVSRRTFSIGLSTTLSAAAIGSARAQSFATHDIRVISGFPAGSGGESMVRYFAEKMQPLFGQKVVVETMTETGGGYEWVTASNFVANAKPDGHTICLTAGALLAANQHLLKNPAIDVGAALYSFGTITHPPCTLLVRADAPTKTLAELTTAVKAKGDKARYGLANGAVFRVIAALYRQAAGLPPTSETIYKSSGDMLKDLSDGTLDFGISNNAFSAQQEKQGRVRILAISLPERLRSAPQYPTFKDSGYDIDVDGWWAGFAPAGTPRPIIDELGRILSTVVMSDEVKKFLSDAMSDPLVKTPDQSQAHFREQIEAWGKYVRVAQLEKQE